MAKKKSFVKVRAVSLKRGNSIKLPDGRVVVLTQDPTPAKFAGMVRLTWGDGPLQHANRSQNESIETLG